METEVGIIGGGVVGCLMAAKLCQKGIKVTLLEAGSGKAPYNFPDAKRDIYTNSGELQYALNTTRVKAIGGSSNHWGAMTPRLLPTDFKSNTLYGVGDDWPISYDDLEPFYGQAERELGVAGNMDNNFGPFRSSGYPMPGPGVPPDLKEKFQQIGVNICSQPRAKTTTSWNGRPPSSVYRAQLVHLQQAIVTGQLTLITDATVTMLELARSGKVMRAIYTGLEDKSDRTLRANFFILAAGGVESPRLLLNSACGKYPDGLANQSGLVGRYFMDHHRIDVVCNFDSPFSLPFDRVLSFQYYRKSIDDDRRALLLTIWGSPTPKDLIRQYFWGEALHDMIKSNTILQLRLGCTVEAIPVFDNYVDVDPEVKNVFGSPAPRIHYSLDKQTMKSLKIGHKLIKDIGQSLEPETMFDGGTQYLAHHMGTCRMSTDPARGIVDPNLMAHGVPNLMVVGSSVFLTGGCGNPTLTIAALTLRAVDFITRS